MWTRYQLKNRLIHNDYKDIEIFDFNYFSAYDRESKVFKESVKFSKAYKRRHQTHESYLKENFYNFQLLVELIKRFHSDIWISSENLSLILYAYEDLKLAYRFLYLWYYTTAWIHLRWFFEKNIYWIYYHFKRKKEESQCSLKDKMKECLKNWELGNRNGNFNKYYLPVWEIIKLYSHYSSDYIHKWKPNTNLSFSEKEFRKTIFLIELTLIYIPRFFKVTLWKSIEKYWNNKIPNKISSETYHNYLQFLFWENKLLSNQYSEIYNLINDNKENEVFLKEVKIEFNNLFEKGYLDDIKRSDRCRKKAKWDKEKYIELFYNNK